MVAPFHAAGEAARAILRRRQAQTHSTGTDVNKYQNPSFSPQWLPELEGKCESNGRVRGDNRQPGMRSLVSQNLNSIIRSFGFLFHSAFRWCVTYPIEGSAVLEYDWVPPLVR